MLSNFFNFISTKRFSVSVFDHFWGPSPPPPPTSSLLIAPTCLRPPLLQGSHSIHWNPFFEDFTRNLSTKIYLKQKIFQDKSSRLTVLQVGWGSFFKIHFRVRRPTQKLVQNGDAVEKPIFDQFSRNFLPLFLPLPSPAPYMIEVSRKIFHAIKTI